LLLFVAQEVVDDQKNKNNTVERIDQHKEKKREETRDWSNISGIKELKAKM